MNTVMKSPVLYMGSTWFISQRVIMNDKERFKSCEKYWLIGTHLSNRLMGSWLPMKDYAIVTTQGKSVGGGNLTGGGNPRLYGIVPLNPKI